MIADKRRIELLAPARDLETARAAIQHGADAVYIGAPKHGARAAAGVPLEDLRQLCSEAHLYGVRVYVTLNTILYDHELEEVQSLIWEIYHAGADALIVQDLGITMMELPPIPLHSSTQCDTVEPEDAMQLEALGFEQIVLARELNLEQIRRIREVTTRPLEVFVHGALCVSYSGRCYISQAFTKRSANRGECSQQCRLPYNLLDSRGTLIREHEHLLSPRDLNRSRLLEELLEAGASSLKIEGRLKSVSYVKNITAYYRQMLDEVIAKYPERYERASRGRIDFRFRPVAEKSFNRGFTEYQFVMPSPTQPKPRVVNVHSPKSQGEYLGELRQSRGQNWSVRTDKALSNGDGLLYITPQGEVGGINVNRSLGRGQLTTARPLSIPAGSRIYRNHDQEWERMLSASNTAERRLPLRVRLSHDAEGLVLELQLCEIPELRAQARLSLALEPAKRYDEERLRTELSKLGETIYMADEVVIDFEEQYFVPLSLLGQLRREAVALMDETLSRAVAPDRSERTVAMPSLDRSKLPSRPHFRPDYRANISNRLAEAHYRALGYTELSPAYELAEDAKAYLMCTKHCIKHELGYCTREAKGRMPYTEPLYLEQAGQRIRLEFDCARCQMLLLRD